MHYCGSPCSRVAHSLVAPEKDQEMGRNCPPRGWKKGDVSPSAATSQECSLSVVPATRRLRQEDGLSPEGWASLGNPADPCPEEAGGTPQPRLPCPGGCMCMSTKLVPVAFKPPQGSPGAGREARGSWRQARPDPAPGAGAAALGGRAVRLRGLGMKPRGVSFLPNPFA